ncbi:MAG: Crp/Fnr family transcriptional regulator [Ferruginibacter sp.]
MSVLFKQHLDKFIEISQDEFLEILPFFEIIKVKKKENLMREGEVCRQHYFVLNGCVRKFFVNEKGIEQTTEFALENWWITDNISFEHGHVTLFTIQAVEHSEILTISRHSQESLLQQFPKMERYFRFIYQRAYAASQMRIKFLYEMSKEEFYRHFYNKHPEFVQRIPQYLIASYLGLTPEYLSEIRARKIS